MTVCVTASLAQYTWIDGSVRKRRSRTKALLPILDFQKSDNGRMPIAAKVRWK